MRILAVMMHIMLALSFAVAGESMEGKNNVGATIVLKFNDEAVTVHLNDSQASRDFVAMLPLTLTFRDYNATEKVSDLPKPLSTDGSPSGCTPSVGDFTYYAPWGNLAIFYLGFRYSNSLIPLGTVESGVEKLAAMESEFSVYIEAKP